MNLEVYRNFVAVVENGSIRRAAEHLFVAQPALSVQILRRQTYTQRSRRAQAPAERRGLDALQAGEAIACA